MRISYRHCFVYIHVDRTGGTSISKALDPFSYQMNDYRRLVAALFRRLNLPESYRWRKFSTQHMTANDLKQALPDRIWNKSYKFAFIRNPWDWLLSIYYARLQNPVHPEYELVRYLGSFKRYVDWWGENQTMQQTDYIFDQDGELMVDFVGRFEFLQQDFESICKIMEIDAHLSHLNKAIHRKHDYKEIYDTSLIEKVASLFPDDIALGYEFDRSLPEPISNR